MSNSEPIPQPSPTPDGEKPGNDEEEELVSRFQLFDGLKLMRFVRVVLFFQAVAIAVDCECVELPPVWKRIAKPFFIAALRFYSEPFVLGADSFLRTFRNGLGSGGVGGGGGGSAAPVTASLSFSDWQQTLNSFSGLQLTDLTDLRPYIHYGMGIFAFGFCVSILMWYWQMTDYTDMDSVQRWVNQFSTRWVSSGLVRMTVQLGAAATLLLFAAAAVAADFNRPAEFSVALVSIIGVVGIVLWTVGFVVMFVIKSTFKRYTTHNKTYSTGVLLKAFVKAKFELMLLMMSILFAPVLYTLSQGTLLVADWNDSWAAETRRAFNDHSACYLMAFRPHQEYSIPIEDLTLAGTTARSEDTDEAFLLGFFERSYSLRGFPADLRTTVIDGYFGCDTIAGITVLCISNLGILLLVSVTFYVFAHLVRMTRVELRACRWYASLRSAEERCQVMETEYSEQFSSRDRAYASVVLEAQRQFKLLKSPIRLTKQGLKWIWESVCVAGGRATKKTFRKWKENVEAWDRARLHRKFGRRTRLYVANAEARLRRRQLVAKHTLNFWRSSSQQEEVRLKQDDTSWRAGQSILVQARRLKQQALDIDAEYTYVAQQFAADHVLFVAFWGAAVDCAGSTMLIRPFAPRTPYWTLHLLGEAGLIAILGASATLWSSGTMRLQMMIAVALLAQLSTFAFDPYSRASADLMFDFLLRAAFVITLLTLMLFQMPSFPTELAEVVLVPLLFAVLVYTIHQLGVFTALQRQYALFCDAVKDSLADMVFRRLDEYDLGFEDPNTGLALLQQWDELIKQQRRAKLLAWPETRPPYLLSFFEKLFKVKWAALQGITLDRLRTSLGLTVLHIALVKGKAEAVRWLLEAHPGLLSVQDSQRDTPVGIALKECAFFLMRFGELNAGKLDDGTSYSDADHARLYPEAAQLDDPSTIESYLNFERLGESYDPNTMFRPRFQADRMTDDDLLLHLAAQIVDHEALEADDDDAEISATTSNVSKKRADSSSGRRTAENARRLIKSAAVDIDTFNNGMLSESGVRWMICKYAEMLLSSQLRQYCAGWTWDVVAFTQMVETSNPTCGWLAQLLAECFDMHPPPGCTRLSDWRNFPDRVIEYLAEIFVASRSAIHIEDAELGGAGVKTFRAICRALRRNLCPFVIPSPYLAKYTSAVTSLILPGNGLTDGCAFLIAEVITRRTTVSHLDLSRNLISTVGAATLFSTVRATDQLTTLKLDDNRIGPTAGQMLALMLKRTTNLVYLSLANNSLGAVTMTRSGAADDLEVIESAVREIGLGLRANRTLQYLDLSGNQLGPATGECIGSSIRKHQSLTYLNLSGNNLTDKPAAKLLLYLQNNQTLCHLSLANNQLAKSSGTACGVLLREHVGLYSLDFSHNQLGTKGCKSIALALRDNKHATLTSLNLSHNYCGGNALRSFCDLWQTSGSLTALNLSHNPLGVSFHAGGAVKRIGANLCQGLAGNRTLVRLNLSHTELPSAEVFEVLSGIRGSHLHEIQLSGVALDDACAMQLASALEKNPWLKAVDVTGAGLGPAAAGSLMRHITHVSTRMHTLKFNGSVMGASLMEAAAVALADPHCSIQVLHLAHNQLGEQGGLALARGLAKNTSITDLDISSNLLTSLAGRKIAESITSVIRNGVVERTCHIRKIKLSDNPELTTQGTVPLITALANSTTEDVAIARAKLGTVAASVIASALTNLLVGWKRLDLSGNLLAREGASKVAWAARRNPRLVALDLSGNRAGPFFGTTKNNPPGGSGLAIEEMIESSVSLRVLALSLNAISPLAGQLIFRSMLSSHISTLIMRRNLLDDTVGQTLARVLVHNCRLQKLDLGYNRLGFQTAIALAEALPQNFTLTELNLEYNALASGGTRGAAELSKGLARNVALRAFVLDGNKLGAHWGCAIAEALFVNRTFTAVSLKDNNLDARAGEMLVRAYAEQMSLLTLELTVEELGGDALVAYKAAKAKKHATANEPDDGSKLRRKSVTDMEKQIVGDIRMQQRAYAGADKFFAFGHHKLDENLAAKARTDQELPPDMVKSIMLDEQKYKLFQNAVRRNWLFRVLLDPFGGSKAPPPTDTESVDSARSAQQQAAMSEALAEVGLTKLQDMYEVLMENGTVDANDPFGFGDAGTYGSWGELLEDQQQDADLLSGQQSQVGQIRMYVAPEEELKEPEKSDDFDAIRFLKEFGDKKADLAMLEQLNPQQLEQCMQLLQRKIDKQPKKFQNSKLYW